MLTTGSATRRGDGPLGLVMAPTRELAQQIEKEFKAFTRTSRGLRTCILVGGAPLGEQKVLSGAGCACVVCVCICVSLRQSVGIAPASLALTARWDES